MRTQNSIAINLADYQPFPFSITHTSLAVALHPDETIVTARLLITRKATHEAVGAALFLNGEALKLLEVSIDSRVLTQSEYSQTDDGLLLVSLP